MTIYTEKCKVCENFTPTTLMSLIHHVTRKHKITSQEYYDAHFKKEGDGLCVICSKPTKYRDVSIGYWSTCGHKCGGILHRQNLKANEDKQMVFVEKMRVIKTNEWAGLSSKAKEARLKKSSETTRVNNAKLTPQERLERYSRYYKCDDATIARLNTTGRDQCHANWKNGISGYGVNAKLAYKGRYKVTNIEKYDGNPTEVIFRSQWECRFMSYLDNNSGVIKWSSEEIIVPYFDEATKRWRRYFPDFCVVVKQGSGTLTQLIEIKPFKECSPPVKSPTAKTNRRYIKESLTYVTNQCKWKAAESYCADRNWKFKVITEKDLGML